MRVLPVLLVLLAAAATAAPVDARDLREGMAGPDVRHLQERLSDIGYMPAASVSGRFGRGTWHAVVAFQGWSALARDGVAGTQTRKALRRAQRPTPASARAGIEVHVAAQVMLLVRGGRAERAIHVSTGAGGATPVGRYRILRRERMSWSRRFAVWMPFAQYFTGGYALHEYPSVPAYPASHGCVRVPAEEVRRVWDFGRLGMRLWVQ